MFLPFLLSACWLGSLRDTPLKTKMVPARGIHTLQYPPLPPGSILINDPYPRLALEPGAGGCLAFLAGYQVVDAEFMHAW